MSRPLPCCDQGHGGEIPDLSLPSQMSQSSVGRRARYKQVYWVSTACSKLPHSLAAYNPEHLLSLFPRVRNPDVLAVCCGSEYFRGCRQGAGQGRSHLKVEDLLPDPLMSPLTDLRCMLTVGGRHESWPWAPLHPAAHHPADGLHRSSNRVKEGGQDRSRSL